MHGLGNDFVVLDALRAPIDLNKEQIRLIADRRLGIGCDQVLMIEPGHSTGADIYYRIFNADGGEVAQCGNGVRCVGEYLRLRSLITSDSIRVETNSGLVTIYFEDNEQVRVDMGIPVFEPEAIPLATVQRQPQYLLSLSSGDVEIMAVSIGNPHAVLIVDDVANVPVSSLGAEIQQDKLFPESVNVGFMEIIDPTQIRLRVNERGVGETLACGTGACGAVVVGINAGRLAHEVEVQLKGGILKIGWAGEGESVWMTGPATTVYEGQIEI